MVTLLLAAGLVYSLVYLTKLTNKHNSACIEFSRRIAYLETELSVRAPLPPQPGQPLHSYLGSEESSPSQPS